MKVGVDKITLSIRYSDNSITIADAEDCKLAHDFAGSPLLRPHKTSNFVDFVTSRILPEYSNDLEQGLLYWHYSPAYDSNYWHKFCLYSAAGSCLVTIFQTPKKPYFEHNLITFGGLSFATSALNPLRDINLHARIASFVQQTRCNVTAVDFYIDTFGNQIPYDQCRAIATPRQYKKFHRGTCVRGSKKTKNILPNLEFAETIYYGHKNENRNKVCLYLKHLSPRQGIHTADNPLKFVWNRFELRLRKDQAKKYGAALLLSDNLPADLAKQLPRYLDYINPETKKRQEWYQDLLAQCSNL